MPASFKHTVPTTGMGQPNFSTCWWASYRMIFQYLKRPSSSIDDRLNGIKIDVDDCKENGLADTDYAKAASVLGLKGWSGLTFSKEPSFIDFGLSDGAEAFLKELDLGPLWVSRIAESRPGKSRGYHVVVAVGYNDDSSKIIYNNPFPGPTSAIEMEMRANLFVRNITAAAASVQGYRYATGGDQ
jgi:hypothetical protein